MNKRVLMMSVTWMPLLLVMSIGAYGETKSSKPEAKKLAGELGALLAEVLNSPNHQRSIGKEDPEAKAERMKRKAEFDQRYK